MSNTFKSSLKASSRTIRKSYSPFPLGGEFYLRDGGGACFKAILTSESFAWVEIDPEFFPAANEDKRVA